MVRDHYKHRTRVPVLGIVVSVAVVVLAAYAIYLLLMNL